MRILIFKYGALGDVVRTSYFLKGIQGKHPSAEIDWLTSRHAVDLIRFNPLLKNIFTLDQQAHMTGSYDWVISLDDEYEIVKANNEIQRTKTTGTFLNENRVHYTPDSSLWFDMGLVSRFGRMEADMLKKTNKLSHAQIFSSVLGISVDSGVFYNSKSVEAKTNGLFEPCRLHVGLNLSAGQRWPTKSLRMSEARKLVPLIFKTLNLNNPVVHLLGGLEDLLYNNGLFNEFKHLGDIVVYEPSDLLFFAAYIKNLFCIISSDSMALHLAISQKVPSVSFYAPTSAVEIDTFGCGEKVLSTSSDYCSYRPDADNSSITAERIISALVKIISKNESAQGVRIGISS